MDFIHKNAIASNTSHFSYLHRALDKLQWLDHHSFMSLAVMKSSLPCAVTVEKVYYYCTSWLDSTNRRSTPWFPFNDIHYSPSPHSLGYSQSNSRILQSGYEAFHWLIKTSRQTFKFAIDVRELRKTFLKDTIFFMSSSWKLLKARDQLTVPPRRLKSFNTCHLVGLTRKNQETQWR